MSVRILIADDHAIVRHGVRDLLADELPDAVLEEAASGPEALARVAASPWELVILDLAMPGRDGLEVIKEMRAHRPGLRVLVYSGHAEETYGVRALRAGAVGYVVKDAAVGDLLAAVKKVLGGGRHVSAALGEALAARVDDDGRPRHEALSDRELQVLRMIGRGRSVKQIAAELHLSEKTVSTYRTRILEKLALETTAELMRYALDAGLA